jgi:hypothetical protein
MYNFVKFWATKKGITTHFFHPSLLFLFLDPGSGMGKNQDPGSGINIPDPQHLLTLTIRMIICLWKLREKLINNKKMLFLTSYFSG